MEIPSKIHFAVAKRILRYIAKIVGYGIWYSRKQDDVADVKLCGYSDADFANYLDDRRIISAYIFTLCSGVIFWS